jgi:hypothetical protein
MHRQMMSESVDRDRSIAGSERCTWRLCTILLTLVGSALLLIGVSVVFLLPSLLPDDSRFIGASPVRLETAAPYLYAWPARLSCYCGNRCAYDCAGSDGASAVGVERSHWCGDRRALVDRIHGRRQLCHQLRLQVGAARYRGPLGARHGTLLVRGSRAAIKDGVSC